MKEYICVESPNEVDGGMLVRERELIRCKDCKYFDPPHVEKNGERHEYSEFPPEAFDTLLDRTVTVGYGINVGGRCTYYNMCGYPDDKSMFVPIDNYCGRAEPKDSTAEVRRQLKETEQRKEMERKK